VRWSGQRAAFFLSVVSKQSEELAMAMDVGAAKGSLKADINVTPLVDVMLVLLIIMMLIAPMLGPNRAIALPEADNSADKPDTQAQTVVAIDARSMFYVDALPVTHEELVPRVQRVLEEKTEKLVYVKGDKDARYSAIMDAMDALRKGQIENIALITERKPTPSGGTAERR
jgi:biopolymer transport protein TolR